MPDAIDYKILYEKLTDKVKRMRAWQKQKDQRISCGVQLAREDHKRMRQLERQVDDILQMDEESKKVFLKSNQ